MEELLGIKVGETTKDGKYTLKKSNFFGWCVNDAPALMKKSKGTDYVVPIIGALKFANIADVHNVNIRIPENKIEYLPASRLNPEYSSFLKNYDTKEAIVKFNQLTPN